MEQVVFAGTAPGADVAPTGATGIVCGVPSSAGTPHEGTENGPYFLRRVSQQLVWGFDDAVVYSTDAKAGSNSRWLDVGDLTINDESDATEVADSVQRVVEALPYGVAPGLIGGDHSLTAGAVRALVTRYPELVVVQFDHHLDVQVWTPEDHGGDLDALFHTNVMSHVGQALRPGHLLQVGIAPHLSMSQRAIPRVERTLAALGTQVSSVSSVLDDDGRFVELVGSGRDVYVTIDVDVLDSGQMSSTGYPATVGLGLRRLVQLVRLVGAENRIAGFDVVEFAARRDDRAPTTLADAARAALLVAELIRLSSPTLTFGKDPAR